MDIKGKVHEVAPTVQVTDSLKKRELIVEYVENPQYPEYLKFEAIQDRCNLLDNVKAGDDVEVFFNLRGRPWTDKNNSDPAQRNRPLVGVAVLRSLQPSGPGKWSGTLYNVENGNTYEGHLLDVGPRTIRIEGCAIGICGGRNLSRIQ